MKVAILSRYQNTIERGAETFVKELSLRLSKVFKVDILSGKDSDSIRKILRGKYDVVVAMNGRGQAFKASLARVFGGYKLIIPGQSGIGRDDIFNILIVKPDVFVALTDYMKDWAKKWSWGTKIVKINNGVDLKRFSPVGKKINLGLKKPIVVSVGALAWYKHHERTIKALELVPDVSLLIVGQGELKDQLQDLCQRYLKDRYKIISAPFDELPQIYRSADLFVLPSWNREAFGIVYIEALASNLPVVAPDDLSKKEIVGNAGLLTDVEDPQKYARAIKDALKKDWKDIPRLQSENFSWDKISKQYEELVKELAG